MKIAVIGAGGVGGYFGGKIAKAGYNVSFLARGNHMEALQKNGLIVKSIDGDYHVENIHATNDVKEIGIADLVIVAVKAWQLKEISQEIIKLSGPDTMILPLQNGVMAVEELSEFVSSENILPALCRIISMIEAPGIIHHIGVKPYILFGEKDNTRSLRVEMLAKVFQHSGINWQIPEDINAELWKKFISICVSGLLAVSRTTYGEMREIPETRQMMVDLFNEICSIARKIGVNIASDFIDKTIAFIDSFPYNTTSSLTRDVLEGKPSEIEYQNGTVVRLGQKYGVPTPVNSFIYGCILPMEMKARGKTSRG